MGGKITVAAGVTFDACSGINGLTNVGAVVAPEAATGRISQ